MILLTHLLCSHPLLIPPLVSPARGKYSLIPNGQIQSPSKNNKEIIWMKCASGVSRILVGHLLFFVVLFASSYSLSQTAETILTTLLSGSRAIDRGALCSHPGAELGTDKKKNPVNLSDTLACVRTKRMLTHRHNWRDHAVPVFPPARHFPSLRSCAGKLSRREMTKNKETKITKSISSTEAELAMSLWERMALMILTRDTRCVFDSHSE